MEHLLIVPSRVRSAGALIERTGANDDAYLEHDDSAFCALTDFRRDYVITVEADGSIDDALADMNRLGVHALYPQASSPNKGCIIPVADVMTLWNELTVVNYESLQTLTALDVYEMFQGTGLTHLLVIENHGDESAVARGLLSRATLAKRLRHIHSAGSR